MLNTHPVHLVISACTVWGRSATSSNVLRWERQGLSRWQIVRPAQRADQAVPERPPRAQAAEASTWQHMMARVSSCHHVIGFPMEGLETP